LVSVTGAGFKLDSAASVGGSPAAVTLRGTNIMRALAPPHEAGRVDVEIPHDCAGTVPWATSFTCITGNPTGAALTLNPESGPTAGGRTVTISDPGFKPDDTVSFEGKLIDADKSSVPGRFVVQSPAHAPGRVEVVLVREDQTPSPRSLHF